MSLIVLGQKLPLTGFLKKKDYLILMDYYSNCWEIDQIPNTESITVARKLKAHFARYGIPDILMGDDGPLYTAQSLKGFLSPMISNTSLAVLDTANLMVTMKQLWHSYTDDHRGQLIADVISNSDHITLNTNTPTRVPNTTLQQTSSPDITTVSNTLYNRTS